MKLRLYQVDAFTDKLFGGNPAAVVPLREWLPEATMQAVARENNLSETAFFVPRENGEFDLRWFTPAVEVDLCGHATLGTAWVLFNRLGHRGDAVTFHTRSGPLTVVRDGSRLTMDFPAQSPEPARIGDVAGALGKTPEAVLRGPYALAVFRTETEVLAVRPDFARVASLDAPALIVTAPGRRCDFVSRFFAPRLGVDEDPVTGSAHCILVPYWAARLGRTELFARQLSVRGGALWCSLREDRVLIAGKVAPYLEGTVTLDR